MSGAVASLPRISVVIPAYGAPEGLSRCLASLFRQEEPPFEVVVADDASPADLAETCRRHGARHVRLPVNRGPGEARNAGVRAAAGEILAFTDADCAPPPDWIRRIRSSLATPGVAAVAGTYGRDLSGTFWGELRQAEARFHHLDERAEVHSFIAANFAIRRDVLERAGGFPPLRIGEDLLLGLRLCEVGHAVRWDPGLTVDQAFRPTLSAYFRQQLAWSRGTLRIHLAHPASATMHWSVRRGALAPQIPLTGALLACAAGAFLWPPLSLAAAASAAAILALNAPFLVRVAVLRGIPFAAGAALAVVCVRNVAWLLGAAGSILPSAGRGAPPAAPPAPPPARRNTPLRWAFRLALLPFLALALLEGGLRIAGFPKGSLYLKDPHLRWRYVPGWKGEGSYAPIRINSLGFRGEEIPRVKRPGTLRVACLGDSCTFGSDNALATGSPTDFPDYPSFLDRRLDAALRRSPSPSPRFRSCEVINAGTSGYSAFLGLRLFRERIRALTPDVVTAYFGWNDHWMNFDGRPDPDQVDNLKAWLSATRLSILLRNAILWGNRPGTASSPAAQRPSGEAAPPAPVEAPDPSRLRVPPPLYRALLAELVSEIRSAGATPVLIVAPVGIDDGWAGRRIPFIFSGTQGGTLAAERYLEIHRRYQEITREVARETGCACVDLEALVTRRGRAALFDSPEVDPIHMNRAGLELAAEEIERAVLGALETPSGND